jgi:hypothetical protein
MQTIQNRFTVIKINYLELKHKELKEEFIKIKAKKTIKDGLLG